MKRLRADSDTEESSDTEASEAEESSGAEYSDGEESSESDADDSQNSEKINYISSKLMNMNPKIRGVVQGWLQRSTNKRTFQDRTAQLIRVLRSPSKTAELMKCLHKRSAEPPAEQPASSPTPVRV